MNRLTAVAICSTACLVALIAVQTVSAQIGGALPEAQVDRIRQNCLSAQTTLRQLQVNDAGTRSNRGSLYETISTKLMAPLNSRITLNRLDGLQLAATSLEYDKRLTAWRSSYRQYDESMSQTLTINCTEQPVAFYDGVVTTREKRQKLRDDTAALVGLLQTYKADFETFASKNGGGNTN